MKSNVFVKRDGALTQSNGRWGALSIFTSCVTLGFLFLILKHVPVQGDTFESLMVYWMISIFSLLGLHQGYFGLRSFFRELGAHYATKAHSWQQDYRWRSVGGIYSSRKKLFSEYMKGLIFFFFLAPFVYIVFFKHADSTPLWAKLVVAVFVLALGLVIYSLRTAWLFHFLYGNSYLKWNQLPLQPGIPFSLEFINPRMLREHQSLEISIRFIQEVWVSSGSGKNSSSSIKFQLLHEYRQPYDIKEGRLLLSACLPADSPTNAMASAKACYWELVVHNPTDLKFHPYLAWFYLPVYSLQHSVEEVMA